MSKLDTQSKMNMVNKNMAGIVRSLDRALQANNLEQVSQVSRNLPLPLPLSLSLHVPRDAGCALCRLLLRKRLLTLLHCRIRARQTMDKFEQQFESLDVQSECVQEAMGNQQAMSTPEDEVNSLMMQVADEHGLETGMLMPNAGAGQMETAPAAASKNAEDDLSSRLANLRGM